jgi:hypothetical protein
MEAAGGDPPPPRPRLPSSPRLHRARRPPQSSSTAAMEAARAEGGVGRESADGGKRREGSRRAEREELHALEPPSAGGAPHDGLHIHRHPCSPDITSGSSTADDCPRRPPQPFLQSCSPADRPWAPPTRGYAWKTARRSCPFAASPGRTGGGEVLWGKAVLVERLAQLHPKQLMKLSVKLCQRNPESI